MRFEGMFPHRTGWKSLGETVQGTGGVATPGGAQTTRGWHLGTRSVVPVVVGPGGWLDSVTSNDSVIPWISLLLQEGGLVSPSGWVQV